MPRENAPEIFFWAAVPLHLAELKFKLDTDTLEIDKALIRSYSIEGRLTTSTGDRALTNGDGSEVQLRAAG